MGSRSGTLFTEGCRGSDVEYFLVFVDRTPCGSFVRVCAVVTDSRGHSSYLDYASATALTPAGRYDHIIHYYRVIFNVAHAYQ